MPLLLSSVKQNYLNKKISTQGAVGTAHGKGASPLSFGAFSVILSPLCHSARSEESFLPLPRRFVILSEAKNLFSRPRAFLSF